MKIGIISDTHGLLRPEVMEAIDGCNLILHGGDINRQDILDRLWDIAPVKVVRGNNDREWAEDIPMQLSFELGRIRVCMAHMKRDLPGDWDQHDLVIVGHTHRYEERNFGRTTVLNPGSCGPRRFNQDITMATAELEDGRLTITRIDIPHPELAQSGKASSAGGRIVSGLKSITGDGLLSSLRDGITSKVASVRREGAQDHTEGTGAGRSSGENSSGSIDVAELKKAIEIIISETQKNRTPARIAGKYGIDRELVEQIVRLYLTHPGVTADGILAKMGY